MIDQITALGDKLKRSFYFIFSAILCITDLIGASKPDEGPTFSYKSHIDLNALQHATNSRDIQFSMLLYNTKGQVIHSSGALDHQFDQNAKKLDLFHYWDKKEGEKYLVAMTKVAFIINTSPSNYYLRCLVSCQRCIAYTSFRGFNCKGTMRRAPTQSKISPSSRDDS